MQVNERVVLTARIEGFIGGDPPSGVQVRLADGQSIQTSVANLFNVVDPESEAEESEDKTPKKSKKQKGE